MSRKKYLSHSHYVQARKQELITQGLCWRCGKNKPMPPRSNIECDVCLDKGIAKYKARRNDPEIKEKDAERARQYYQKVRREAIDIYGGKCSCCGETEYAFLDFDHIDGGGTQHQKEFHFAIVHWLRKHKYPKSIRILCCNCNQGRARNGGVCPHQIKA